MKKTIAALILFFGLASAALAQWVGWQPGQGPATSPLVASSTGTTGSIAETLTGVSGRWTYICGFVITSSGTTTATNGNVTITGLAATMNFNYAFVSSGQGVLGVSFNSCIPSSAENTNIVLTVPAGGTGTTVAATAWGYTN